MVEIRIDAAHGADAHELLRGLGEIFGAPTVSFDDRCGEARVRSQWDSRDIDRVIETVESWLVGDGAGSSAKLWIGDAAYTMVGSAMPPNSSRFEASACSHRPAGGLSSRPRPPSSRTAWPESITSEEAT